MDRKVATLTGFLNATEGRDKMFKVTQYGLRTFCYNEQGRLIGKEQNELLVNFAGKCSLTRKFLKIGQWLAMMRITSKVIQVDIIERYYDMLHDENPLNYSLRLKEEKGSALSHYARNIYLHMKALFKFFIQPKVWLKMLVIGRLMGLAGYFAGDNIVWAIKTKLLYRGDKTLATFWLRRALYCHVASCVCALLLNTYQAIKNWNRLVHIRKRLREHNRILEEHIDEYDLDRDSEHSEKQAQMEHYLQMVKDKMANLRFTSFKLMLDVFSSSNMAFKFGIDRRVTASMSLTSALMATWQLWKRIEAGKYNPCKSSSGPKKSPRLPRGLEPPGWFKRRRAKSSTPSIHESSKKCE
uniref:Uncharacterized protein n=2 Tax=Lotharella globosa TaxID=91324 RepID=A0A7S3YGE4_9EUKA